MQELKVLFLLPEKTIAMSFQNYVIHLRDIILLPVNLSGKQLQNIIIENYEHFKFKISNKE